MLTHSHSESPYAPQSLYKRALVIQRSLGLFADAAETCQSLASIELSAGTTLLR